MTGILIVILSVCVTVIFVAGVTDAVIEARRRRKILDRLKDLTDFAEKH